MSNANTFYPVVAAALRALQNCEKMRSAAEPHAHWTKLSSEWADYLNWIMRNYAPSGAGFDKGTRLDLERSRPDRLVFITSFHHMNDAGFYDGWTDHFVTVTPSFIGGFDIRVNGRDRNDIRALIADTFDTLGAVSPETLHEWRQMERMRTMGQGARA